MAKRINLTPDINWEQESMNFRSNSWVIHKKEAEQTKHAKIVQQGIYKQPVYISLRENFLSIKCYDIRTWSYYRVGDYKTAPIDQTRLRDIAKITYTSLGNMNIRVKGKKATILRGISSETRIYKNRKGVRIMYGNLMDSMSSDANILRTGYFIISPNTGCCIKEIKSEDEIESNAVEFTKSNASELVPIFSNTGLYIDLRYPDVHTEAETQRILKEFFEPESEENFQILCTYKRTYKATKINFTYMTELKNWLITKPRTDAPYQKKINRAEELVSHFTKDWNKEEKNIAYWYRIGDEIVLLYKGSGWSCEKGISTYNTKTQTRFCAEFNGTWGFPVPSYKYIIRAFDLNEEIRTSYSWYDDTSKKEVIREIKTVIRCKNGTQDLFEGTNMDWVIHNIDKNESIIPEYKNGEYETKTIAKALSEKHIRNVVYGIIFSTKEPVLEQFLKSKLWHLYFKGIAQWDDYWLEDNTKPGYAYGEIEFNPTQTNLKKMFGMTMEQLRILDEECKITDKKKMPTFKMHDAEKALGVKLNMLDLDTFRRVIKIAKRAPGSFMNEYFSICGEFINQVYVNPSLNTRLKFMEIFKEEGLNSSEYRDYLNMRDKLKKIQAIKSDIPGIWNEKHYPVLPEPGSRFMPFVSGTFDWLMGYRFTDINKMHDVYYNSWRFTDLRRRGDMILTTDGVKLTMTRSEMLKFLHDEASYWITFFEDETKDALFKDGVKRVDEYQWKDDKSGLEIIAPTSIADLKTEGAVLSHCVGSYVDSIINGGDNIMFIRRTDMADKPYYTLDFTKDGEIRQVHCFSNGGLSSDEQERAYERSKLEVYNKKFDIVSFLKRWAKAKAGKILVDSIKESYSALCAVR